MSQPKFRKLPVGTLTIDERYQRELNPARVLKIVAAYNPQQLSVLEVSSRGDDTYVVFDGQHRLEALREMGADSAPCLVHSGLTAKEEAELFARLQLDRRGLSALERFRAQVFAGDEQAIRVQDITTAAGFVIGKAGDAGEYRCIRAVSALERIYRREGPDRLADTLDTVRSLWAGDKRSTDGYLLEGMAQFLQRYGNRVGSEQMDHLAATSPTAILRRALGSMQGGGSHARHAVEAELRKVAGVRGRPRKVARPAKAKLELVTGVAA